ncbi:hypothetical protein JIP62_06155 [Brevundimonas vitis]|uniref:Mu-like prophage tail protein gpP n=1 Tax=Brevundimonas vitisensis TaxID=2800818 RepID=A0ABX7BTN5_9CAUL|nr:hypothetical protein [Brevundimonas vitisensis]QQQ19666.1 hypothetical protein JIP62_06155 [Brevundimonas vitisensis]
MILNIAGRRFDGWTDVAIERRLDALCGGFDLGLTERWPGQPEKWRIEAGDAAQVQVDGETLITGWVDRARYQLSPEQHPLRVAGRDRTCDLVDCSAEHRPGSWINRTVLQIATDLTAPFGITVRLEGDGGPPFARFALEPGETVLAAIERMTVLRGLLCTTDAAGELVLTRPSEQAAGWSLEEGVNIEEVVFDNDMVDRFSRIVMRGHDASDESAGSRAARPSAEATDAGVKRHRPLVIVADEEATTATLNASARWEASVRAAKAQTVTVTASGWRAPDQALFRPNLIVPVKAPAVGIEAELLIAGVRFRRSAREGSRTELMLVRKEAYSLKPVEAPGGRRTAAAPPARP